MYPPSPTTDIPLTQQAAPIAADDRAQPASQTPSTFDADFAEDNSSAAAAYPRVDGGKEAWLFLAGAFTIEMLVWYVSSFHSQSIEHPTHLTLQGFRFHVGMISCMM